MWLFVEACPRNGALSVFRIWSVGIFFPIAIAKLLLFPTTTHRIVSEPLHAQLLRFHVALVSGLVSLHPSRSLTSFHPFFSARDRCAVRISHHFISDIENIFLHYIYIHILFGQIYI